MKFNSAEKLPFVSAQTIILSVFPEYGEYTAPPVPVFFFFSVTCLLCSSTTFLFLFFFSPFGHSYVPFHYVLVAAFVTYLPDTALSSFRLVKISNIILRSTAVFDDNILRELRPDDAVPSFLKTGTDFEASGSSREIHELQAALQAAQMTATGSKHSGTGKKMCEMYG